MKSKLFALLIALPLLFGAVTTAMADGPEDEPTMPGQYSLNGGGMYRDPASGLMCIDVYLVVGGDQDGALNFAKGEIQKYVKQHKYQSYSVIMSESITPSKYTFYVSFK